MTRLIPLVFLVLTQQLLAGDSKAANAELYTDAYIPVVVVGGGWSQQIVIQNVDEDPIAGTLEIFDEQGDPWEIELEGEGKSDTFFINVLPGQMQVLDIPRDAGKQVSGYGYLDLNCCVWTLIQTIYRRQSPDLQDFAASMIAAEESLRSLHLMIDNRKGNFTAVGLLTTDECYSFRCETKLEISFKSPDGEVLATSRRTQQNETFKWVILEEFPQLSGRLYSMEVSSGDPDREFVSVVGVSFQIAPNGVMTVISPAEH